MQLTLIRHAAAVDREVWTGDDAERPLTPEGQARFNRVVAGLQALSLRFDLVLHSPWLRAAQTAALLAPLMDGPRRLTPDLAVSPQGSIVPSLLMQCGPHARVAMVGHEPFLSELLGALLAGEPSVANEALPLGASAPRFACRWKKGGAAWLEAERPVVGGYTLVAFLSPAILRALAR